MRVRGEQSKQNPFISPLHGFCRDPGLRGALWFLFQAASAHYWRCDRCWVELDPPLIRALTGLSNVSSVDWLASRRIPAVRNPAVLLRACEKTPSGCAAEMCREESQTSSVRSVSPSFSPPQPIWAQWRCAKGWICSWLHGFIIIFNTPAQVHTWHRRRVLVPCCTLRGCQPPRVDSALLTPGPVVPSPRLGWFGTRCVTLTRAGWEHLRRLLFGDFPWKHVNARSRSAFAQRLDVPADSWPLLALRTGAHTGWSDTRCLRVISPVCRGFFWIIHVPAASHEVVGAAWRGCCLRKSTVALDFTWTLCASKISPGSTPMLKSPRLNAESFTQDGQWRWLLRV